MDENDNIKQLVMYNTLTKREEQFVSRTPGVVKLFTCGPSVYQKQHLGNYRTYMFEDILQKYLEYLGFVVERAINYTDIEDKAIVQAEKEGKSLRDLTDPVIEDFNANARQLGILLPTEIPRATESVEEAVELIQLLIDAGTAYWHDGNVYYDPLKYPRFGEVYGLDMSRWPKKRVRFSKDTYRGKRWNLGDFILWHGTDEKPGKGIWETKIGRGRPAWNIQDPAMIIKTLGPEIDIHTGGIDNVYRHHDYNRAVIEGVYGTELAHYWYHGEHLIVNGEKMSKSKGNTLYPDQIYKKGCEPRQVRFLLLYSHYRDKLNITEEFIGNCKKRLERIRRKISESLEAPHSGSASAKAEPPQKNYYKSEQERLDKLISELPVLFQTKMNDDLRADEAVDGIEGVLTEILELKRKYGMSAGQGKTLRNELEQIDRVLGVFFS